MKLKIAITTICLIGGVIYYSSLRTERPKENKATKLLKEAENSITEANNSVNHADNSIRLLQMKPLPAELVKSQ